MGVPGCVPTLQDDGVPGSILAILALCNADCDEVHCASSHDN